MNKNTDAVLILMSNYHVLSKTVADALERNQGMSANEVRDLAVATHTVSGNIVALTDDKVKFHWRDPRPACRKGSFAVCGGPHAKVVTEHIEFVTCGKCKRSILFRRAVAEVTK